MEYNNLHILLLQVNNAFVRLTFTEQDQISEEWINEMQGRNTERGRKCVYGSESNVAEGEGNMKGKYVQGMTILSGPLLFVMPEVGGWMDV